MAEQLDLPQRALGVDLVVEGVGDLLDGHLLPRLGVERGADDAVGALADGEDGGLVLGGDLEDVAEDVVLDEPPAVAERGLDVLHGAARRPRGRGRRRPPGLRHLRVRRLRPAGVHLRPDRARGEGGEGNSLARFGRFPPPVLFRWCGAVRCGGVVW